MNTTTLGSRPAAVLLTAVLMAAAGLAQLIPVGAHPKDDAPEQSGLL